MRGILILAIISLVALAACTAPPAEAPRAVVEDTEPVEESESKPGEIKATIEVTEEGVEVLDPEPQEEMAGNKVPLDMSKSSFEFEGFGPGKSHVGSFDEWEGYLYVEDGKIVGGEGIIQTASVNTGIGGLDSHLKNDDFFDVEKFPTIVVKSTGLDGTTLSGEITFRGVTKKVSFPVRILEDSISTDFVIDTTEFNFKNTGVNPEVRLAFEMSK